MAPKYGFVRKLGIDTASPVTKQFDFTRCNIGIEEELRDLAGMRGTRSHDIARMRSGKKTVSGLLGFQPTAVEWASLLPWILGGTPSGTSYPLAESLTGYNVAVDRVMAVHTYSSVLVDRGTVRGSQHEPVDLELDVSGADETEGAAGTFPALTLDSTTSPFMFKDLVLTVGGTTYQTKNVEITINNMVDRDRYFNSATRSPAANAKDREITVSTTLPYGDASAVYGSGSAGVAAVATFTFGATSLVFSFVKLAFGKMPPDAEGREEIMIPVRGRAYSSGATAELVTTLDSTP
jgi:hypothetical protein